MSVSGRLSRKVGSGVQPALRAALATALAVVAALPALAQTDLDPAVLPTFALAAPPAEPSPWTGFYVGSEVFGFAGSKGVRGGFGGGGYAGYNREFDNGVVLGVQGDLGYAPGFWSHSPVTGYNFASTQALIGYDMGRLMPFVTLGVGLAQPNLRSFGYAGPNAVANDLFNAAGDLRSFETAGAGFAYKLTDKVTVELAVQAWRGTGFIAP